MSKRFIISEEEKRDIRSRYGLVNEQDDKPDHIFVRGIQRFLNEKLKIKLKVDGLTDINGNSETAKAIMRYQEMLNKLTSKTDEYRMPLTIDGNFGYETHKFMPLKDKQRLDDLVAEEGGVIDQFINWLSKMF
jgi:hypothetical protein